MIGAAALYRPASGARRRSRLAWLVAWAAALWSAGAAAEPVVLTVGTTSTSLHYLPIHVAAERTAAAEGLTLRLVTFDSPTAAATAVTAGSVDVSLLSLNTVLTVVAAGHPVRVFWVAGVRGDFEWFARDPVRTWADLRGRTVAIGGHGTLSDVLTRYVLRRRGLDPGRDLQLLQVGSSPSRLAALRAGRVDAALLASPLSWDAEAAGLTRLGSQATEVAETWPQLVFTARQPLLAERGTVIRALLRAYVRATRWVAAHREETVELTAARLGYPRRHPERGYPDLVLGFHERGTLPAEAMPAFWDVAVASGEVDAPWPEARFFDRRFVDSFEAWVPR
jgi:NitT/TauT family transport system substrate-binding protein